ncbi:hypothetical protein I2I11_08030, partial [Pontibacter sp. 172403-2]|nr:hypothetical protein [Pontibacter sp. 172403-2]
LKVPVGQLDGLRGMVHYKALVGFAVADPPRFFEPFTDKGIGLKPEADIRIPLVLQGIE